MKRKVFSFLLLSSVGLLLLPVWNVMQSNEKGVAIDTLYRFDVLESLLSRQLYDFGISLDPENVIIGKQGWLYLGDFSRDVLTTKRRGVDEQAISYADKFTQWVSAWAGATQAPLYVLISPDKSTIYSEFLPDWATLSDTTILDLILNKNMASITSPKANLLAEKSANTTLYFQTDTHWNALGSWIAYKHWAEKISQHQQLFFLTDKDMIKQEHSKRPGGDLSRYLRLKHYLQDETVRVRFNSRLKTTIELVNFDTGQLIKISKNKALTTPKSPLLVKSSNALNEKKVLWLRDSFGKALSPLMAMTFSETLQIDYRLLNKNKKMMNRLLEEYQPDLILLSVVERNLTWATFNDLPD
jgi:hypothetical protein